MNIKGILDINRHLNTQKKESGHTYEIFPFQSYVGNGVWSSIGGGYGICWKISGTDPGGLDEDGLKSVSAIHHFAALCLPRDSELFQYLIVKEGRLQQPRTLDKTLQALTAPRLKMLNAQQWKTFDLYLTFYVPGKLEPNAKRQAKRSRRILREIQSAATVFELRLKSACDVSRLDRGGIAELYSYLLNLVPRLTTDNAANDKVMRRLGMATIQDRPFKIGRRDVQMLSLGKLPRGTRPDMFHKLLTVDHSGVWCGWWKAKTILQTRSEVDSKEKLGVVAMAGLGNIALEQLTQTSDQKANMPARAKDKATEKATDKLANVLMDLDDGHIYGEYSLFGLIHEDNEDDLEATIGNLQHVFGDFECKLIEETRGALSAYLSMFPGQSVNHRKMKLRSDHFARMSLTAFVPHPGWLHSADLDDEYTYIFEDAHSRTPWYYTPYQNGVGNALVVGMTRRGKTLTVNALMQHSQKHGGYTFIFDHGESYSASVLELGGSVSTLGLNGPRMNPFRLEYSKDTLLILTNLIKLMVQKGGGTMNRDRETRITAAIRNMYEAQFPPKFMRLRYLPVETDLKVDLAMWIGEGIYGDVFDNEEDELEISKLQVFEFAKMGARHNDFLEVLLTWVLLRCQTIIQNPANLGHEKHIIIEELYKRLGNSQMLEFILTGLKSESKNLARLTLVTQHGNDLGQNIDVITGACPTTFFLGGIFNHAYYREVFKLNDQQIDDLATLPERHLIVKIEGDRPIWKILKHEVDPDSYKLFTTTPRERLARMSKEPARI